MSGGDCADCDNDSQWMELKRIDEEKCELCFYENDSCHYECVGCQDSKNWIPKPNLRQTLTQQIKKYTNKITRLEYWLGKCPKEVI